MSYQTCIITPEIVFLIVFMLSAILRLCDEYATQVKRILTITQVN